jgi:hypothetical protein
MTSPGNPGALARMDAEAVVRARSDGAALLLLDAVPGSGKTWIVERLAIQSVARLAEPCMIVTSTNEQAVDLARRFGENWPKHPVTLFVTKDLPLPPDLARRRSVSVARRTSELPRSSRAIVIANADRWSWSSLDRSQPQFGTQIVDEAYQVLDSKWMQVSGLAASHVLVGDPGQIMPFLDGGVDVVRWAANPSGPHVSAPRALTVRHPAVPRLTLRVTHRLSAETAAVIGPSFYPDVPMQSIATVGGRRLKTTVGGLTALDRFINLAGGGNIALGELPAAAMGEYDEAMVSRAVALADRLMARGAHVEDEDGRHSLTADRIGIITPHVSQVTAIRSRLPRTLAGVRVETANRWQGLQTDVTIVWHPLSGRADVQAFHLDAGRLCVMLSRHRIACLLLARAGLDELVEGHVVLGARTPGIDDDPEFTGWQAHRRLLRSLKAQGATTALPLH